MSTISGTAVRLSELCEFLPGRSGQNRLARNLDTIDQPTAATSYIDGRSCIEHRDVEQGTLSPVEDLQQQLCVVVRITTQEILW